MTKKSGFNKTSLETKVYIDVIVTKEDLRGIGWTHVVDTMFNIVREAKWER